ncbi:MAG: hypothetical protein K2L11_08940 [Muribaculaceae bacterium]|nr:hypothetical protein [Muribaculaceae bacterium]
MDIKGIISALPILALLCACQSEAPKDTTETGRVLTVKATLPGSDETRTHITYGNPSIDTELFRWDTDSAHGGSARKIDFISLFNVTRLEQCPSQGIELDVTKIDGRNATFESVGSVNASVEFKAGDVLFVNYWETSAKQIAVDGNFIYDPRKIFSIKFGSEANKPQFIVKDPDDSTMSFMQGNLFMYDIVTVEEDNQIPDLHFRWLSAIIRVSLRNETGHDIYPTKLEVEYPGTKSFFNTTLYCSVDTEASNESSLIIYDDYANKDYEFYKGSVAYTDSIGTTINGKIGTDDAGESIANGKTYDLYLSTVPRIENTIKGNNGLDIHLIESHQTNADKKYSIKVKDFDVPIEAGKRYWFNLTAVEEDGTRKLMLTSEWLKEHPEAKP